MSEKTVKEQALEIAQIVEDGKGEGVTVIDVSELNSWTDYFVIATVTSSAQWQGIARQVKEYTKANDLEEHKTFNKSQSGDDWNLLDYGPVVIHLMTNDARNFYELEKLWHNGKVIK